MSLNHICNSCGGSIEFAPEHTGLQLKCPHCGILTVLTASGPPAAPQQGGPHQAFGQYPPQQQMPNIGMGGPMPQPARIGISTGGIIGIVVGALLAVGLIVLGVIMLAGKSGGGTLGSSASAPESGNERESPKISDKEDFSNFHKEIEKKIAPAEIKIIQTLAGLDSAESHEEALEIMYRVVGMMDARNLMLKLIDPKTAEVKNLLDEYIQLNERAFQLWKNLIDEFEEENDGKVQRLFNEIEKLGNTRSIEWLKRFNRMCEKHNMPKLDEMMK